MPSKIPVSKPTPSLTPPNAGMAGGPLDWWRRGMTGVQGGGLASNKAATGTLSPASTSLRATTPPVLRIAALSANKSEGNSGSTPFTFVVTRSGDLSASSTVRWAVSGSGSSAATASDFLGGVLPGGTLSFAAGESSKTLSINVAGDSLYEANEGFRVTLSGASGATIGTAAASGTIRNDDAPPPLLRISASSANKSEGNSGSTPFTFVVTRSGSLTGSSAVNWAVNGAGASAATASDFLGGVLPGGTLSFAAGESSKTLSINVAGDSLYEANEGFRVTLSGASGATIGTAAASGTIRNDDASLPVLNAAASSANKSEGDSGSTPFSFVVTRGGSLTGSSTVNWSVNGSGASAATASDFAGGLLPSGTLSFAAGESSKTIDVNVAGDTFTEANESFNLVLSNAAGASIGTGTATGTILNDDTASVDRWTIMVYIASDNNLEPYALHDLNEMESVLLPSNVNVVTLVDRAPGYATGDGDWTDTRQGSVVYDTNLNAVSSFAGFQSLGELNTGAGSTLTSFIDWSATNYSADHYGLVVWNHGGGLYGVAWDDSSNGDRLTSNELASAIDNSSVNRFDMIGFDACLMGMVEQSWDLRNLTDVVVASEGNIPGDGWAYDRWLGDLASNPDMTGADLGRSIVTTYAQEYAGWSDITLSAVQTSALGTLNNSLEQFINDALAPATTATDWDAMRTAAAGSPLFPSDDPSYAYRDLGQFMAGVGNGVSNSALRADAGNVAAAVGNAVIARSGTVAGATGLSIYLPYGSAQVSPSYTAENHSFLASSNWEGFLAAV